MIGPRASIAPRLSALDVLGRARPGVLVARGPRASRSTVAARARPDHPADPSHDREARAIPPETNRRRRGRRGGDRAAADTDEPTTRANRASCDEPAQIPPTSRARRDRVRQEPSGADATAEASMVTLSPSQQRSESGPARRCICWMVGRVDAMTARGVTDRSAVWRARCRRSDASPRVSSSSTAARARARAALRRAPRGETVQRPSSGRAPARRRWDEALGRGELAARGVARYRRVARPSRAGHPARARRAAADRPATLVGTPGAMSLLGPCVIVAARRAARSSPKLAARPVGGAILAAHATAPTRRCSSPRRVPYGAAPMLRVDARDARRVPIDEPVILVVDDDATADQLGVPRL